MLEIVKTINGVKQLVPLTTDSGQGLPLGAWTSFEDDQPRNGYLKAGTTFNQSDYPALYAMLGTNVVPDKGYGLDWDNAQAITFTNNEWTVTKNGWIVGTYDISGAGYLNLLVNNVPVSRAYNDAAGFYRGQVQVRVDKNDVITISGTQSLSGNLLSFVPYLHPMFIKAVIGPIEDSAADQVLVQAKNAMFPDYTRGNLYTTAVSSYIMPEDGYVVFNYTTTGITSLQIDGIIVSCVAQTGAQSYATSAFSGFVKKGSVLTITSGQPIDLQCMKVFGLV